MDKNKKSFSSLRIIISTCVVALVIGVVAFFFVAFKSERSDFLFFYEEVCASCETEEKLKQDFKEKLEGLTPANEIKSVFVNTFSDMSDRFNSECDRLEIPPEKRILPMVIYRDSYLFGGVAINEGIRAFVAKALKLADPKSFYYYHRPTCQDCVDIEENVVEVFDKRKDISVLWIDTTNQKLKSEFKKWLADESIPEKEWQVPFLAGANGYLSGKDEISEKIEEFLLKQK